MDLLKKITTSSNGESNMKEKSWSYRPKGCIRKISMMFDDGLCHLKFKSVKNESFELAKSDPRWKIAPIKIKLNSPGEYLIGIRGRQQTKNGLTHITGLTFTSNIKEYGPYGEKSAGTPFTHTTNGVGLIDGFHGESVGKYVTAIGVYVKPPAPSKLYGGDGGKSWKFLPTSVIRRIVIVHGTAIDSIAFKVVGSSSLDSHGGKAAPGSVTTQIDIDTETEYVKSISGTHGKEGSTEVVKSLSVTTNKRTLGPFGSKSGTALTSKSGTAFSLSKEGATIVGFHGLADKHINAIGVYFMG